MADVHALCKRLVLIFRGEKHFDDSIDKFENILGQDKIVSFSFNKQEDPNDPVWADLDPRWNENFHTVELRIPEKNLKEKTQIILEKMSVVDFQTEKMPIERVMKTLMKNPDILKIKK
jgi:ABC-2 type transport system ATP-binding protein